jgi:hypothetical protein
LLARGFVSRDLHPLANDTQPVGEKLIILFSQFLDYHHQNKNALLAKSDSVGVTTQADYRLPDNVIESFFQRIINTVGKKFSKRRLYAAVGPQQHI